MPWRGPAGARMGLLTTPITHSPVDPECSRRLPTRRSFESPSICSKRYNYPSIRAVFASTRIIMGTVRCEWSIASKAR